VSDFAPSRTLGEVHRAFTARRAELHRLIAELDERRARFGDADGSLARALKNAGDEIAPLERRLADLDAFTAN